jgi:hypothetical protein
LYAAQPSAHWSVRCPKPTLAPMKIAASECLNDGSPPERMSITLATSITTSTSGTATRNAMPSLGRRST